MPTDVAVLFLGCVVSLVALGCSSYQLMRRRTAEAADQAKTDYLATLSHELRTPLNAIIGLLELVDERAAQGRLDRTSLGLARRSATDLLELIGATLDIARIEAGHLDINPRPTELLALAQDCVDRCRGLATDKALEIRLEPVSLPECLELDPIRVRQVLDNLLGNAVKFTRHGYITLSLELTGASADEHLEITVRDTGCGIAPEELALVIQPYQQGRNNPCPAAGSGLGLAISQRLSTAMGGTLELNSAHGAGTTARVRLPVRRARAAPPLPGATNATIGHCRVLLVDDEPANRLLVRQQLEFLGHRSLQVAGDIRQAVTVLADHTVDLILIDLHLPDGKGTDLARQVRELERSRGSRRIRLVGYTADARPCQRTACREAGMDDCLFKPLTLDALRQQLLQTATPLNHPLDLLTGGDPARLRALLQATLSSCRTDLDAWRGLTAGASLEQIQSTAHRIQGMARLIDDQALAAVCQQVAHSPTLTRALQLHAPLGQALCSAIEGLESATCLAED